jgi:hypothetical protein
MYVSCLHVPPGAVLVGALSPVAGVPQDNVADREFELNEFRYIRLRVFL